MKTITALCLVGCLIALEKACFGDFTDKPVPCENVTQYILDVERFYNMYSPDGLDLDKNYSFVGKVESSTKKVVHGLNLCAIQFTLNITDCVYKADEIDMFWDPLYIDKSSCNTTKVRFCFSSRALQLAGD